MVLIDKDIQVIKRLLSLAGKEPLHKFMNGVHIVHNDGATCAYVTNGHYFVEYALSSEVIEQNYFISKDIASLIKASTKELVLDNNSITIGERTITLEAVEVPSKIVWGGHFTPDIPIYYVPANINFEYLFSILKATTDTRRRDLIDHKKFISNDNNFSFMFNRGSFRCLLMGLKR